MWGWYSLALAGLGRGKVCVGEKIHAPCLNSMEGVEPIREAPPPYIMNMSDEGGPYTYPQYIGAPSLSPSP